MFDIDIFSKRLMSDIGNKRYHHSLRVMEEAIRLNTKLDDDLVKTAAILHDCAKYNEKKYYNLYGDKIDKKECEYEKVLHSFLGAEVAKKVYNIDNQQVLDAIRYHTSARANMTQLDKIIYLADATEPARKYPGVEKLRQLAKLDLDEAILYSLDININYLIEKKALIHPLTIEARNFLIKEKNE